MSKPLYVITDENSQAVADELAELDDYEYETKEGLIKPLFGSKPLKVKPVPHPTTTQQHNKEELAFVFSKMAEKKVMAAPVSSSSKPLDKSPKGRNVTWQNYLEILPEAPRLSDFMLGTMPSDRVSAFESYLQAHSSWSTYMKNEKTRRHQEAVVRRAFESKSTISVDPEKSIADLYTANIGAKPLGEVLVVREKKKQKKLPRKKTPLRTAKKALKAERKNLHVQRVQQKAAVVKSRAVALQTETPVKAERILNKAKESEKVLAQEIKQQDKVAELRGTRRISRLELSAAKVQERKAQLVKKTDPTVFTALNLDQGEGWQLVTRKKDRRNKRVVDYSRNEKGQVVSRTTQVIA